MSRHDSFICLSCTYLFLYTTPPFCLDLLWRSTRNIIIIHFFLWPSLFLFFFLKTKTHQPQPSPLSVTGVCVCVCLSLSLSSLSSSLSILSLLSLFRSLACSLSPFLSLSLSFSLFLAHSLFLGLVCAISQSFFISLFLFLARLISCAHTALVEQWQYICIYIYIYIHTYTHIYTHIYIYIHIHIYTHTCVIIYIYTHIYKRVTLHVNGSRHAWMSHVARANMSRHTCASQVTRTNVGISNDSCKSPVTRTNKISRTNEGMCHVTHVQESHHAHKSSPSRKWFVGSLKFRVSFAEYRLFYKALLQKRRIILRSVLIVATPKQETERYASIYGGATMSRLLKMIGLFCKRALYKRRYSAKETYNLKEHTNQSAEQSREPDTMQVTPAQGSRLAWTRLFCRISSFL